MQVVNAPDDRLRVKTKTVKKITPQLLITINEMIKLTRTFTEPEGVGLASTQIGENEQFFIFRRKSKKFQAFINPKIIKYSKKTKKFFEGCLSVPNYWAEVERPISVTVRYLNIKNQEVEENLFGHEAWFFQHEFDHINGKLFMDLALEQKARIFKVIGRDRAGAEVFEEVKI